MPTAKERLRALEILRNGPTGMTMLEAIEQTKLEEEKKSYRQSKLRRLLLIEEKYSTEKGPTEAEYQEAQQLALELFFPKGTVRINVE